MSALKTNCWDDRQCCHGPDAAPGAVCPAAADVTSNNVNGGRNAGRFCWVVPRTICRGETQGAFSEKADGCRACSFFRRVKYEEGHHFQVVKPALGVRDAEALHRRLNDTLSLLALSRDVFATTSPAALLARIAEQARTSTGASAAAYLADSAAGELVLVAHAGEAKFPERLRLDAPSPIATALRGRCIWKGDACLNGSPSAPMWALPIGGDREPAGVLVAIKPGGAFESDDEWFLRELGMMAALGVRTANLADLLRDMRTAEKTKARFVSVLMHEIGSPLATIACSVQALSLEGEAMPEKDRRSLLKNSLERVHAIEKLSKRLLDLAAIRSASLLADLQAVAADEILRREVEARLRQVREKGVSLALSMWTRGESICADPDGLHMVFGNLLDNAIKYSCGREKSVDVRLVTDGDVVRVWVRDEGIGIPAAEQARLFEEFYRGSNATASGARGFGLGLAVVKELVDRYGGRIAIHSAAGAGTAVLLEFPIIKHADGAGRGPACAGQSPTPAERNAR